MIPTSELFTLPPSALAYAKRHVRIRGHAGKPGDEPAGETCGSCANYTHNENRTARPYRKCALEKARWTGGPGTDVRKKDPACPKWAPKAEQAA